MRWPGDGNAACGIARLLLIGYEKGHCIRGGVFLSIWNGAFWNHYKNVKVSQSRYNLRR